MKQWINFGTNAALWALGLSYKQVSAKYCKDVWISILFKFINAKDFHETKPCYWYYLCFVFLQQYNAFALSNNLSIITKWILLLVADNATLDSNCRHMHDWFTGNYAACNLGSLISVSLFTVPLEWCHSMQCWSRMKTRKKFGHVELAHSLSRFEDEGDQTKLANASIIHPDELFLVVLHCG